MYAEGTTPKVSGITSIAQFVYIFTYFKVGREHVTATTMFRVSSQAVPADTSAATVPIACHVSEEYLAP